MHVFKVAHLLLGESVSLASKKASSAEEDDEAAEGDLSREEEPDILSQGGAVTPPQSSSSSASPSTLVKDIRCQLNTAASTIVKWSGAPKEREADEHHRYISSQRVPSFLPPSSFPLLLPWDTSQLSPK